MKKRRQDKVWLSSRSSSELVQVSVEVKKKPININCSSVNDDCGEKYRLDVGGGGLENSDQGLTWAKETTLRSVVME